MSLGNRMFSCHMGHFKAGSTRMMQEDVGGPQFVIVKFQPGDYRPSKRIYLHADGLKVTRTYSLISSLSHLTETGVSIRNKIFSDNPPGILLTWHLEENNADPPVKWRVGYYDQPRSWEESGPQPGEQNSITRKFMEQKSLRPHPSVRARPSFLDACSSKARSLQKAAAKKRRKLKALRGNQESEDDSSSSDSSSSSSSRSSSSASSA